MSLYVWGKRPVDHTTATKDSPSYWAEPQEVSIGDSITAIAAGDGHCIALTDIDDILVWGRSREGQLGLGVREEKDRQKPQVLKALEDRYVVGVAGSGHTSYAVTNNGEVYAWGMLPQDDGTADTSAAAGELPGLNFGFGGNTLRERIVEESMNRWRTTGENGAVIESDTSDDIVFRVNGCRVPCTVPTIVASLQRYHVKAVSCGFGHACAVTGDGGLLSCGYNDRGQLGLGHRMNTSRFLPVTSLYNHTVLQVACGSQHNLARVIRPDTTVPVVYVWGDASLGQLGIGVRGRSACRFSPIFLDLFYDMTGGLGVKDVAAGDQHSVCVLEDGKVFVFGHAEYNQMGSHVEQGNDLIDAKKYHVPQLMKELAHLNVAKVVCGGCYSLALTDDGHVYSWGWSQFGVLGRGQFNCHPTPAIIPNLEFITCIAASGSTVMAVSDSGYTNNGNFITPEAPFSDCSLVVQLETGELVSFRAHRFVLCARCPFLSGQMDASMRDKANEPGAEASLELSSDIYEGLDEAVLKAFLLYLYTNRFTCPPEAIVALGMLARDFRVSHLEALCAKKVNYRQRQKWYTKELKADGSVHVPPPTMKEDCAQMLKSGKYADIKLVLRGEDGSKAAFLCHRAVLCREDYFRVMFSTGFSEGMLVNNCTDKSDVPSVDISGFVEDGLEDPALFEIILEHIYNDSVPIEDLDISKAMRLVTAAHSINLPKLLARLDKYLCGQAAELDEWDRPMAVSFAKDYDLKRLGTAFFSVGSKGEPRKKVTPQVIKDTQCIAS